LYKILSLFVGAVIVLSGIIMLVMGVGFLVAGLIDPSLTVQDWQNVNPLAWNVLTWGYGLPLWLNGILSLLVFIGYVWLVKQQNIFENIQKLWDK